MEALKLTDDILGEGAGAKLHFFPDTGKLEVIIADRWDENYGRWEWGAFSTLSKEEAAKIVTFLVNRVL